MKNIFSEIPLTLKDEVFEDLLTCDSIRIERILSRGQTSPSSGWYDQDENEWVMVLAGSGTIAFQDGRRVTLTNGDYINIPKHTKHRVVWTDPDVVTVWLAIFYQ